MIKLLIKKSFFEAWDNLFKLILLNLGFIACLVILIGLPMLFRTESEILISVLFIPGLLLFHLYNGSVSSLLCKVTDYRNLQFRNIAEGLQNTWRASVVLAVLNTLVLLLLYISLPFYFSMGNVISLIGSGIILWIGLSWIMALQIFYPVMTRMNCNTRDTLKKSILITLDNPKYLFFILLLSIVLLALSAVLFLIIPGVSAIIILQQNTLKLLLYKYDWKELNPQSNEKIPWNELLKEDNEKTGSRTLKGLIFPWKD